MNTRIKRIISLSAILLGFFMALLDSTIVNIALPEISKYYNSKMEIISWIMNGYNLAFSVFLITASRLADQFGRKKLFIFGIFMFSLSSLLAGISVSIQMLIFFRVIQGLSAAIVVPVTIPLATNIFPPEKRGAVAGLWGAVSGIAAASGPMLGGILTYNFKWNSIFFVNIPIGIIAIVFTLIFIDESYDTTASKKLDYGGMITLTVAMFSLVYALLKVRELGWNSATIIGLFVLSLAAFTAFIIIERKSKEPMLPMWLLKNISLDGISLTLLTIGAGIMSTTFLLSFLLRQIMGLSALQSGLTLSALAVTSIVFSGIAGPLSSKYGSRWIASSGMALSALSVFLLSSINASSSKFDVVWRLVIGGAGVGLAMTSVMESLVRNIPDEKLGVGSGVTNMARILGTVLGIAVVVTFLNHSIGDQVNVAKTEVTALFQSDTVLNGQMKSQLKEKLLDIKISENQLKTANTDDLFKAIDEEEKTVLTSTAESEKKTVQNRFQHQKEDMKKLLSKTREILNTCVVSAFNKTFKLGSLMLFVGILFGYLSDNKKHPQNANN